MDRSNELRLFISSTFRDLQEEREHLVKKIFPEIRALCRERGITFTEVDLRWGVTREEAEEGGVTRICLEEIDKCRPYFIGLTGNRYGWVPDIEEYRKDPGLLDEFPWLASLAEEGASITDIEFRYGALDDRQKNSNRCAFFFRNLEEVEPEQERDRHLDGLKHRVRASSLPCADFSSAEQLGELVGRWLAGRIDEDFAGMTPPTPLEEERVGHAAFALSRRRGYVPNPEQIATLDRWFAEKRGPLVISAISGAGKSSLLSWWVERTRKEHPELVTIEHYVGLGSGDSGHLGLMLHIMSEIRDRFDRTEELPSGREEIETAFASWLGFATGRPMLIVIDAVNQLQSHAHELHWLPPVMPEGVQLIVSTTDDEQLKTLRACNWQEYSVEPLDEKKRKAVIVHFLSNFSKSLSPNQTGRIAGSPKSAHPLFLRTLLEELRLHGTHEELDEMIDRLLASTDTNKLFQQVLERLERDHGRPVVQDLLSLIFASRNGLSEADLEGVSGLSRLQLSRALLGLDYHLLRRGGLLSFFHDYLRRAVEQRYLGEGESVRSALRRLSDWFEASEITLRTTLELLSALEKLGDDQVVLILSDLDRFSLLWQHDAYEVLRLWSAFDCDAERIVEAYRSSWQQKRKTIDPDRRILLLRQIAELCNHVAAYDQAEHFYVELLEQSRNADDLLVEASTLGTLASIRAGRGNTDDAKRDVLEAVSVARRTTDPLTLAGVLGNASQICSGRNEFDEAFAYAIEHEELARSIGNRREIHRAIVEKGSIHNLRNDYASALECLRDRERIARELGDRFLIGNAISARGVHHKNCGESEQALEAYREAATIFRESGLRDRVCYILVRMGVLQQIRGEIEEGLAMFREAERLGREIGQASVVVDALLGRGELKMVRGEFTTALQCFGESEEIARKIGAQSKVGLSVGLRGVVYLKQGKFDLAEECFIEEERIARDLGTQVSIANALSRRGTVCSGRGEYDKALIHYREAANIAQEIGARSSFASSIGNAGLASWRAGRYEDALEHLFAAREGHRAASHAGGLAIWNLGISLTLIDLLDNRSISGDVPPAFLVARFPDLDKTDWRSSLRAVARNHAERSLETSTRISKFDTLLQSRLAIARITAAEGDRQRASVELVDLLSEARTKEVRAELLYRLTLYSDDAKQYRVEAIDLYRELQTRFPKQQQVERLEQLERMGKGR
ncbi:MAG: tetratricopeptide repeat protein [Ignavibacteriae bacterium]|nr:tetratricopeptide repeat protein [Ignavibacteriota bacterium]